MIDKNYDWGASIQMEWFEPAIVTMDRFARKLAEISLKQQTVKFLSECTPKEIEQMKEILKTKGR